MPSLDQYHYEAKDLRARIELKSKALFREREGVAPLSVSRNGMDTNTKDGVQTSAVADEEIRDLARIATLRDVSFHRCQSKTMLIIFEVKERLFPDISDSPEVFMVDH